MKILDLIQKPLILRDYRVIKAKIRIYKAIIDSQNELDEMNPGYNKIRAEARLKKAINDLPGLEIHLNHLQYKLENLKV